MQSFSGEKVQRFPKPDTSGRIIRPDKNHIPAKLSTYVSPHISPQSSKGKGELCTQAARVSTQAARVSQPDPAIIARIFEF
jgi:hypothetical protein